MSEPLRYFKEQFLNRKSVHLNNAGMAPVSIPVAQAALQTVENQLELGVGAGFNWMKQIITTRKELARFLGANADEVAFTLNCASGLSEVAFGFPLTAKDSVVTLDQEYGSNFYPWQEACVRSGAKLLVVKSTVDLQVTTESLLNAIKPGVKLVALSWVQFQSGTVIDLATIGQRCHEVGAFLIVDGVQGLGQLPFSFSNLPVDFIAGATHKWMCSYQGLGFFAIKPELMKLIHPVIVGCGTFGRGGQTGDPSAPLEPTAKRFESGGFPMPQVIALGKALELFEQTGMDVIAAEISRLSKKLRSGIGEGLVSPFHQASGTTSFRLPADQEQKLIQMCVQQNIHIIKRGEVMRVSPHAFNSDDDIDQFLKVLREVR